MHTATDLLSTIQRISKRVVAVARMVVPVVAEETTRRVTKAPLCWTRTQAFTLIPSQSWTLSHCIRPSCGRTTCAFQRGSRTKCGRGDRREILPAVQRARSRKLRLRLHCGHLPN